MTKPQDMYKRSRLLVVLVLIIALLFIVRLFYLQILTPNYKARAENNAFYEKPIYPPRGVIYDRQGELLVYNKPTYDILVVTNEITQLDSLELCRTLSIAPEYLSKRFEDIRNRRLNPGYSPHVLQTLVSQIDEVEAGRFKEQLYKFPGFYVRERTVRQYSTKCGAQLFGYLAEASKGDIERDSALVGGDYVGKSGVEKSYEKVLRGTKGVEVLLRDVRGRIRGRYDNGAQDRPAIPGRDIYLSIDKNLQLLGENLMMGKRGAVVAIRPATGEILCMVSSPSYDPALLTGRNIGVNHSMLEREAGKPLFIRALMGAYPPGSTFKPTQGAIFLEEGVITPGTSFACYHGYPPLRNRPACHGHASPVSIVPALATSCNAFFCWGLHSMLDDRRHFSTRDEAFEVWKNHMVDMGYGYKLGVDLPGEKRGYIPNSKVYDKVYKQRWNAHTIISIAIGQGEILATPLQMANMAAIIANRGYYYTPHIVSRIDGMPLDTAYTRRRTTGVSANNWEYIVQGMAAAVTGGTCRRANFAPGEIVVCGKTGTAENPHGKDHSAFTGFAPMNSPEIAVAVYVENGGYGATLGVPIGRLIMEQYLKGNLSEESKAIAESVRNTKVYYSDMVYMPSKQSYAKVQNASPVQNDAPIEGVPPVEPAKAVRPEDKPTGNSPSMNTL